MPKSSLVELLQEHRRAAERRQRVGRGGGGRPASLPHAAGGQGHGGGGGAGGGWKPDRVAASITLNCDFESTVGVRRPAISPTPLGQLLTSVLAQAENSVARDKFELEFREDMAYKMGVSVDRIKVTRVMTEEEALAEGDFGDVGGGYDDAFDDGWDVDAGGGGGGHAGSGAALDMEVRQAGLRQELEALNTRQLQARAQEARVSEAQIDDARTPLALHPAV